ncbi:hypothetical protein PN456_20435 [Nodularia spumigena CS-586/05]|uniref:hypothetical protein n=1 Tax=Nodularia spumigena TaxID=70799 RepID=UPI00232B69D1|nr:hypothetical protein [Nodularia spumigena]MDB9371277.1 hypothetical protein [Nodularia spumigena CS-586/05]
MINWKIGLILRIAFFINALPFTLITVLAKDVKAVNLTDGNRTAVVLFSGFAELSFTGLNTINQDLQNQLGGISNKPFSSQVFTDYDVNGAFNYVNSFNDLNNIVIIGDGYGGSSAYDLASLLQPFDISLLIQANGIGRPPLDQTVNATQFETIISDTGIIDPTQKTNDVFQNKTFISFLETEILLTDFVVTQSFQNVSRLGGQNAVEQFFTLKNLSTPPTNVIQGFNYFYTAPSFEVQGIKNINGFTNIDVNDALGNPNLIDITMLPFVQNSITTSVFNVVNSSQPIPENSSILGILIGVTTGAFLSLKRRTPERMF